MYTYFACIISDFLGIFEVVFSFMHKQVQNSSSETPSWMEFVLRFVVLGTKNNIYQSDNIHYLQVYLFTSFTLYFARIEICVNIFCVETKPVFSLEAK